MTTLDDRVDRARRALDNFPGLLLDRPHPQRHLAAKGLTERAHVRYLFRQAGAAGRTRACKIVEEAVRRMEQPDLLRRHPGVAKDT